MAANSDPIQIDMHHAAILKLVDSLMIIRTLVHLGTSASTVPPSPRIWWGERDLNPHVLFLKTTLSLRTVILPIPQGR